MQPNDFFFIVAPDEEISFVDNVIVHKRSCKRTKYHVDIDPSKPVCPQVSLCLYSLTCCVLLNIGQNHQQNGATIDLNFNHTFQPHCDRAFASTVLLKAHIRRIHCADNQRYRCTDCPKTYAARYLLARHTAVHERRRVACPVCSCLLSERTR